MSFSTISVSGAKEGVIVSIPATDDAAGSAGPTVEADLTGNAGAASPNKVHWIEVDCRDSPVENGTFRLYSGSSNPTVGEADAHLFVRGFRGRKITYHFPAPIIWPKSSSGKVYAVYVKGPGGTGGSAAPSGVVKVRLGLTVGS